MDKPRALQQTMMHVKIRVFMFVCVLDYGCVKVFVPASLGETSNMMNQSSSISL